MALKNFPGLRNVVDRFVTLEDTTEHKPHPEPLFKGLELLGGVPKERAAYVGDSPSTWKRRRPRASRASPSAGAPSPRMRYAPQNPTTSSPTSNQLSMSY